MENKGESVSKIIDRNTSESLIDLSQTEIIFLADRIKSNKKESKEAVTKLSQILKTEKYKRTFLSLKIIELLSKHGSLDFHEYLSQDDFMKEFMKSLKQLRGKGGLFSGFESKSK